MKKVKNQSINGGVGAEDDKTDGMKLKSHRNAKEHVQQLQRLRQKDPEFFEFLQEHDKELLEFNDDDIEDDVETAMDSDEHNLERPISAQSQFQFTRGVVTVAMVDSWCNSLRQRPTLRAVRSLMKGFRTACHYGDDDEGEPLSKLNIMSSSVFNKIMLFVLNEMDGILRGLLKLPSSGGKKETILDLKDRKQWKKYNYLVKSYLANSLHVLNQMTDTEMIAFTLKRLRYSSVFLVAFPSLLRKYMKVALHFWGTGGGALQVVSFLFLRDLCVRLGSDCLDECFKGMYKAYVLNCQFVNATKLQHLQFLGNCVSELFQVDLSAAYQHGFVFIRQLAMILREALSRKTKEAFKKVYEWKYINCLELWTGAICAYGSDTDFRPLTYPLVQIISGVARLVTTAQYVPLRLRCVKMLNRIGRATGTFIPISMILLDMLEMKELKRPPTGGVGKAVDFRTVLKVSKPSLKTRSFQEACVLAVIDELAEHLAQWSYSVAFFELSFVPTVRLRTFCKSTKVERFRQEMKRLIKQIESNFAFTNENRMSVSFLPDEPAATSFLEDEKKSGISPLSQYVITLQERARQRNDSLIGSSVIVGEHSSMFGQKIEDDDDDGDDRTEEGAAVFSSSWLPSVGSKTKNSTEKKRKKKASTEEAAFEEDVVEDLVLSSDEDSSDSDNPIIEKVKGGLQKKIHSTPARKGQKDAKSRKRKRREK